MRKLLSVGVCVLAMSGSVRAAPVSIEFWTIDQDNTRQSQVFAAAFERAHPDIHVDVKHVDFSDIANNTIRAVASGGGPDLVTIDNPETALFASHGALLALDPMIAASSVIKPDAFYPGPRASVTWHGHIYGVPRGSNTLALYYNQDMFKAHGIANPPGTWDELFEDAKALTDPTHGIYGLAFSAIASERGRSSSCPSCSLPVGIGGISARRPACRR